MPPGPGRPGGEKRGNSSQRRRRKQWFLSPASGFGGDGRSVPCVHCRSRLTYAEVEADRIVPGGNYRRGNVQPSCGRCNKSRGNKIDWQPTAATGGRDNDDHA